MEAASHFVREQGTHSVSEYRRRVHRLAWFYFLIVVASLAAIVLVIARGRLYVTLAQRSNVETLTLAVILLLFGYLSAVCAKGAWGAVRIALLNLPAVLGRDRAQVEGRKQAALRPARGKSSSVYLSVLVRGPGGDEPIRIPLEDDWGSLGEIVVDGARISHERAPQGSSNSLFAFFEARIEQLINEREPDLEFEIVEWTSIDDEAALQYGAMVQFSRNLERHLGSAALWPCVSLTEADLETLRREAAELCPTIRDEAHLPDLEYQVEHRLPIIPEPLAFIALSRQEKRADPYASMGCALVVVLVMLGTLVAFCLAPPWVPGK